MASYCDACATPGKCCNGFMLAIGYRQIGLELLARVAEAWAPFVPLFRTDDGPEGSWLWWCPVLGKDGRCTDYANRPETCREYEPTRDPLCRHYGEWAQ